MYVSNNQKALLNSLKKLQLNLLIQLLKEANNQNDIYEFQQEDITTIENAKDNRFYRSINTHNNFIVENHSIKLKNGKQEK